MNIRQHIRTFNQLCLINESIEQGKKIIQKSGKDWNTDFKKEAKDAFSKICVKLISGNHAGYIPVFANLLVHDDDSCSSEVFDTLYEMILKAKPFIKNLKNSKGQPCTLFDFKDVVDILQSLSSIINKHLVRKLVMTLPANRRPMIWDREKDDLVDVFKPYYSMIAEISEFLDSSKKNPRLAAWISNVKYALLRSISSSRASLISTLQFFHGSLRETLDNMWPDSDIKQEIDKEYYPVWNSKDGDMVLFFVADFKKLQEISSDKYWIMLSLPDSVGDKTSKEVKTKAELKSSISQKDFNQAIEDGLVPFFLFIFESISPGINRLLLWVDMKKDLEIVKCTTSVTQPIDIQSVLWMYSSNNFVHTKDGKSYLVDNKINLSPSKLERLRKENLKVYDLFKSLRDEDQRWKTDITADMGDLGFD